MTPLDKFRLGAALAFCAGTFLCIACADLLPELQFHSYDRIKLSLALLTGIGLAIWIARFGHGHSELMPRHKAGFARSVAATAPKLNAPGCRKCSTWNF